MRTLPVGINLNTEDMIEAFKDVGIDARLELMAVASALTLHSLIGPILAKLTGADIGTPVKCAAYLYQHLSQDDLAHILMADIMTVLLRRASENNTIKSA